MADVEMVAINEAYTAARRDDAVTQETIEAVRQEGVSVGVIRTCEFFISQSEFLKYATAYRYKKSGEYRGITATWAKFCELIIKEPIRTVDKKIQDMLPLFESESSAKFAETSGLGISDIRHLGRAVSAESAEIKEGVLIVDDHQIELKPENKNQLESVIDDLKKKSQKKEKELKEKLEKVEKNQDKIIREKTRGLELERDHLLKEVETLKPFEEMAKKNHVINVDRLKGLKKLAFDFVAQCGPFIVDDAIKEDPAAIGELYGMADMVERAFMGFRKQLDETFAPEEG